jgi:hypothetical protein
MNRKPLNCLIVALWIWLSAWCKPYFWTRRSTSFHGLILHFGIAEKTQWKTLRVIEYIPYKSRLWTRDNMLLLFRGRYRVWEFRAKHVSSGRTLAEALRNNSTNR